jgi:nicotinate-nucleotide pyrophosphorylase (carboxylating)
MTMPDPPTQLSPETTFGPREAAAAEALIELALAEDLGTRGDLTCQALIDPATWGTVDVVVRQPGVLCGTPIGRMVTRRLEPRIVWRTKQEDGARVARGDIVATLEGPVASLLSAERTLLNFLTHLSGIATLTATYVARIAGTRATILDTRKTHPGYRHLEKYAVRCGGATNHRFGLDDGVLIKDNHLAAWSRQGTITAAVETARLRAPAGLPIEVEVDTLEQLADALGGRPEIVLLDNMSLEQLRSAVALRELRSPSTQLEASGGVTLETVRPIAETGVERISVGALTHSAVALDIALDWHV